MSWRVVVCGGVVLAIVAWFCVQGRGLSSAPAASNSADRSPASAQLTNIPAGPLNLSDDLRATLYARQVMDLWQLQFHTTEVESETAPKRMGPGKRVDPTVVRVVSKPQDEAALAYRRRLPDGAVPLRGYRPTLFHAPADPLPVYPSEMVFDTTRHKSAEIVAQRLAHDGLLLTLAQVLRVMDATSATRDHKRITVELEAAGFPVDLLACFGPPGVDPADPHGVLRFVADLIRKSPPGAALTKTLAEVPFAWPLNHPPFEVATESGEKDLGLLRVQVGGGYRNGIVPGGSLDLILQLLASVPDVDFLVTVPAENVDSFQWLCGNFSSLNREGQALLVPEALSFSAWSQDNGKGGLCREGNSGAARWTTLVPRYACKGEGSSGFLPGDTFLLERLANDKHRLIQSRLLFQGGNVLGVIDPAKGQRVLLLGEPEVCRNTALGLTRAQVLSAFTAEFGVDRCIVLPAASFHVDFDVTLRSHHGKMLVFVNDTLAAARLIIEAGVEAMAERGIAPPALKTQLSTALAARDDFAVVNGLLTLLNQHKNTKGQYKAALTQCFRGGRIDSATGNFRSFLLAFEIMASQCAQLPENFRDPLLIAYVNALRQMEKTSLAQQEILRAEGWQIIRVPSTPDFNDGVNYLNGIQDRTRYIIPVHGGLYKNLDAAASAAFTNALGSAVRLIPMLSAEAQRQHGAVHCAASVYPALK